VLFGRPGMYGPLPAVLCPGTYYLKNSKNKNVQILIKQIVTVACMLVII
jgi:hypothetical protein